MIVQRRYPCYNSNPMFGWEYTISAKKTAMTGLDDTVVVVDDDDDLVV